MGGPAPNSKFKELKKGDTMKLNQQTAAAFALMSILAIASSAHAQTFRVIHTFSGEGDSGSPTVGVSIDAAGNLYGTTTEDANGNSGITYELKLHGGSWVFYRLHAFAGSQDGEGPTSRPLIARDGTLYGSTGAGPGNGCLGSGCGVIYHLQPSPTIPPSFEAPWQETLAYIFQGPPHDVATPSGDLLADQSGNIYGTAENGPIGYGTGSVYELTRNGAGWSESILYAFPGGNDGGVPADGVVSDGHGNLYGAASGGAGGSGVIYELSPSGSGWTEKLLYTFSYDKDGYGPTVPVIDGSGNLFGATNIGPPGYCGGTVWELSPTTGFQTLFCFTDPPAGSSGPTGKLAMDSSGNLYGTTESEGLGYGTVFELSPTGNGWVYTLLYEFTGGADGSIPNGSITFDAGGNLYGTTLYGGNKPCNCGVIWEITP